MMLMGLAVGVGVLSCWLTWRLTCRDSFLCLLDHPNERSLHDVPIPRTGGLAIAVSLFLGLIVARVLELLVMKEELSWPGWGHLESWILGVTMLLGFVSFMDDRGGVPVWIRLGCQFVVSSTLALGAGLFLTVIQLPFFGTIELGWMGFVITILFLVWFTNLYNFMDGIDGLAGGMTTLGCGFMAHFAWEFGHEFIFVSALILSVASVGFLTHNFPPAKIFMGDVGSVVSGFLCGALIVLGCRDGVFDVWVPFILFSPFILDATVTLIRRAWQGEKVLVAHRTHYYQRLVLSGWGHRKTVLAEYAIMVLCGGIALLYQHTAEEWQIAILGGWVMLFIVLALAVTSRKQKLKPVSF